MYLGYFPRYCNGKWIRYNIIYKEKKMWEAQELGQFVLT